MINTNQGNFSEENSWFNCIGDIDSKAISENQFVSEINKTEIGKKMTSTIENDSLPTYLKSNQQNMKPYKQIFKRERDQQKVLNSEKYGQSSQNEFKAWSVLNNFEQMKNNEIPKQQRQNIYSKKYREKKRQHFKYLEQENESLKKKITELEIRLGQKQMEISRLKFMPEQRQFTNDKLNEQFLKKVTVLMQKNKQNPEKYITKYQPTDSFYTEFLQTYSQHGFGGKKKTQILDYYFNQILEVMLRDSQRYLCLICTRSKDGNSIKGLKEYEPINSIFFEILQPDAEKLKRLTNFQIKLHPMVIQFVDSCKQLYKKFEKVMKSINRIHEFMKFQYLLNMDFARKRIIQLETWFQKHKQGKMMRNLRAQWLEQIKIDTFVNGCQQKKNSGSKRKKVVLKDQ